MSYLVYLNKTPARDFKHNLPNRYEVSRQEWFLLSSHHYITYNFLTDKEITVEMF